MRNVTLADNARLAWGALQLMFGATLALVSHGAAADRCPENPMPWDGCSQVVALDSFDQPLYLLDRHGMHEVVLLPDSSKETIRFETKLVKPSVVRSSPIADYRQAPDQWGSIERGWMDFRLTSKACTRREKTGRFKNMPTQSKLRAWMSTPFKTCSHIAVRRIDDCSGGCVHEVIETLFLVEGEKFAEHVFTRMESQYEEQMKTGWRFGSAGSDAAAPMYHEMGSCGIKSCLQRDFEEVILVPNILWGK